MVVAFWFLAVAALVLALLQLAIALGLGTRLTPAGSKTQPCVPIPAISALVPLKGAPAGLAERLLRLLTGLRDDDQLVLALETEDDPGHAVVAKLRDDNPARNITIVLSGPPGERMGKQHNLSAALARAKHDLVMFMDDDVLIERANIEEAAEVVAGALKSETAGNLGAAFALPFYGVSESSRPQLGGDLVAAYTNHGFAPNMASLALRSPPGFIIGGFWMTSRAALDAIGGLERFTTTVGDDAAIGRAFTDASRRNVLLRTPVRLEPERLDLGGGAAHVLKWLTLLRAEGLGVLLICYLTWNPLATGILAALLTLAAPDLSSGTALSVLVALLALRSLAVIALDARVLGLRPVGRYLLMQVAYEALLAPWLFLVAAFRREVTWRGRKYRLGPDGIVPS
ncbi:MAG: glycosyltransferase [Trueperaceae bacterium]|nr:glycosyltransferase [Trueperaceae bacterium]